MNKLVLKNVFYLIAMSLIALLMICVGFSTLKDNFARDIKNVDSIDGVIEKTEIISTVKRVGGVSSPYLKLKFLKIELKNSNERLYAYNANQEYLELNEKLNKGREIIVYFKKLKETEVKNNVFKMDSGQQTILTHKDYKEKEYFAGIVMVLFGVCVLLVYGFMWKTKGLKEKW